MTRTPRQLAADWGKRVRADMRKARWCLQAETMLSGFGDHGRTAVFRRMAHAYVVSARANNHRRIGWLRRARWRDRAPDTLPGLLRRQAG